MRPRNFFVSLKWVRYDRYLKSGCLDIETFGVQESLKMNNFTIEEEMENIDAQNAAKVETTKVEALTHESTEESNDEEQQDHRERNEDSAPDDSEKIRGSASSSVDYSSVNIDAEDCSAQGTKRISVRSTRQNFFSIETFSPRYN